jgi:hypothetical protein
VEGTTGPLERGVRDDFRSRILECSLKHLQQRRVVVHDENFQGLTFHHLRLSLQYRLRNNGPWRLTRSNRLRASRRPLAGTPTALHTITGTEAAMFRNVPAPAAARRRGSAPDRIDGSRLMAREDLARAVVHENYKILLSQRAAHQAIPHVRLSAGRREKSEGPVRRLLTQAGHPGYSLRRFSERTRRRGIG